MIVKRTGSLTIDNIPEVKIVVNVSIIAKTTIIATLNNLFSQIDLMLHSLDLHLNLSALCAECAQDTNDRIPVRLLPVKDVS